MMAYSDSFTSITSSFHHNLDTYHQHLIFLMIKESYIDAHFDVSVVPDCLYLAAERTTPKTTCECLHELVCGGLSQLFCDVMTHEQLKPASHNLWFEAPFPSPPVRRSTAKDGTFSLPVIISQEEQS